MEVPQKAHCRTQLLRATLGNESYAPISRRLNNNGYKGLHYTGQPDKKGASLGLSGDGLAEAAPGMAAIIATGPVKKYSYNWKTTGQSFSNSK